MDGNAGSAARGDHDALTGVLDAIGTMAVAVSGGVDSLTLAAAAHRRRGSGVRMFHAASPAVPPEATARTRALAAAEGWRLEVIDAGEFTDAAYLANPANRCFFCKTNLYGAIRKRTDGAIVAGTNRDDLAEYRPGLEAARNHGVRHPYLEAGMDKNSVRALARRLGLGAVAELPAQPCLSSRLETGIAVDAALLVRVHEAERYVAREIAPATVRCRVRAEAVVIELDAAALGALAPSERARIGGRIALMFGGREVGFAPYRAGSAFLVPGRAPA